MLLIAGYSFGDLLQSVYTATPWCSCEFADPASCSFGGDCTFSGGGQCSFSAKPPSACGS